MWSVKKLASFLFFLFWTNGLGWLMKVEMKLLLKFETLKAFFFLRVDFHDLDLTFFFVPQAFFKKTISPPETCFRIFWIIFQERRIIAKKTVVFVVPSAIFAACFGQKLENAHFLWFRTAFEPSSADFLLSKLGSGHCPCSNAFFFSKLYWNRSKILFPAKNLKICKKKFLSEIFGKHFFEKIFIFGFCRQFVIHFFFQIKKKQQFPVDFLLSFSLLIDTLTHVHISNTTCLIRIFESDFSII